jgi:hypothetical protein
VIPGLIYNIVAGLIINLRLKDERNERRERRANRPIALACFC